MARYTNDFKVNALKLSDEIGINATAEELGIPYETVARWRKSRSRPKLDAYAESRKQNSEIASLQEEIRELRNTNVILLDTIKNLSAIKAQ